MSPLEREDRIQVMARQILLARAQSGDVLTTVGEEVGICFALAEYFIDCGADRKAELPLPLPPLVDPTEPEAP